MITEGSKAPEVSLLDISGREVDIAALAADGPSVLFFLRHYA
jgi:peroxiredoxin